jgi:hypothetical protein
MPCSRDLEPNPISPGVIEMAAMAISASETQGRKGAPPDEFTAPEGLRAPVAWMASALVLFSLPAGAETADWAATVYAARVSGEETWQGVIKNLFSNTYVDSYLVAGALSREYAQYLDGALRLEAEGQLARNFGDQDHWEVNAMPVVARWTRFPWSERVRTSAAFGLGLSYATELPPVEVELEGGSHQTLVYWMVDLTAGPVNSPWEFCIRLHHRSVAWGLFGEDGGVNALGLGMRYNFRR